MHDVIPDPPLTAEQQAEVAQLSTSELERIDRALLAEATGRWRKVAFIVGSTIGNLTGVPELPDVFYSQRVKLLVDQGRLEAQGDLDYMRYSEVRLSSSESGERKW